MIKKWLLPCNTKYFDVVNHFETNSVAYFKRNRFMTPGDIVYIYVAKPYSEILFKGIVLEKGISADEIDDGYHVTNDRNRTFVKVELIRKFKPGTFPRQKLAEHKLGQVVNQQLIRFEIEDYITSIEEQLDETADVGGAK